VIRTERLTKSFGGKTAVAQLDLSVEPGEIFGFLGPNGAGKSTTVRILTGLIPADSGRAIVAGFDVANHPIEVKQRFGYVPETPKLYESLTADGFLDVMGALHHLAPETSRTRRQELMKLLGLEDAQYQRLREFSKGMRQKVVIAAALLHRPEVLILDEPFDGIDANTTLVLKALLREMAAQGRTILFSSHVLDVVERICTRICIIDKGRKLAEGSVADICRAAGAASLDEAFGRLTGVLESGRVSAEILAALSRD
jgi:ABC-2 type transport system ATP-binding protein